jgi:Ca2+-binding RTX toxin-like protein
MRRSNGTRLSVQRLDDREVPACLISQPTPDTLVVTGDGASDAVVINDNGAGSVWGTATGAGQFSFSGIKNIQVNTEGGNDRVVYNLIRNMLPNQQRVVTVGLGNTGNDAFTANLFNPATGVGSDLMAGSSLIMGVFGGAGDDRLAINADHDVDVAAGARLKMVLFGQDGNDIITGYYHGENDGAVSIRDFDGGAGDDIVRGYLKEDLGSTGANAGIVHGGDGNDQLALFLLTQNPPIEGLIDGGAGSDTAIHTANVNVVNVP